MAKVSAFEVWVDGTDWKTVINHATASKAKYQYWRNVTESWPDVPITAMRARRIGGPQTTDRLAQCAQKRGFPVVAGSRVKSGILMGVVVDGNSSANFNVLIDDDCPKYPGMILNIHPGEMEIL